MQQQYVYKKFVQKCVQTVCIDMFYKKCTCTHQKSYVYRRDRIQ